MNLLNWCILALAVQLGTFSPMQTNNSCKNGSYILGRSQQAHDPDTKWHSSNHQFHIQEPRVGNPKRFTRIKSNIGTGTFEMSRGVDGGLFTRIVDTDGTTKSLWSGEGDIPESLIETTPIMAERNKAFQRFYNTLNGLPMTVEAGLIDHIGEATAGLLDAIPVYRIPVLLKEELIAKHWTLLIAKDDFRLQGLEFNHPEDTNSPTELIRFEGEFKLDNIRLPRMRHWYLQGPSVEYLGSDIIVEQID